MIRTQETGAAVCLTVTLLDGWVLARSAFHHTMNYRSVMCFGQPQCITEDDDKLDALELFMRRWLPAAGRKLRPTKRKELAATTVMSMPIQAAARRSEAGRPMSPRPIRRGPCGPGTFRWSSKRSQRSLHPAWIRACRGHAWAQRCAALSR